MKACLAFTTGFALVFDILKPQQETIFWPQQFYRMWWRLTSQQQNISSNVSNWAPEYNLTPQIDIITARRASTTGGWSLYEARPERETETERERGLYALMSRRDYQIITSLWSDFNWDLISTSSNVASNLDDKCSRLNNLLDFLPQMKLQFFEVCT